MPNIIDYIEWRGDLSFENSPINEIDDIIFARFSYLPFKYIELKEIDTIENIALEMKDLDIENYLWNDDKVFLQKIGNCKRFKDIKVSDYIEIFDEAAEKQFAAITLWIQKNQKYISFRGTDSSLVGWKEDINMGFKKDVPSQKEAVKYLNSMAEKYKDDLIIGGHSKGGNLAVYSAVFCKDSVKNRIERVINADGPGFDKSVILTDNYKKILNKIQTYIPQSSIVGRLLEHEEEYQVVKSIQKGIMQHDIYSWEIEPTKLIRIPTVTNNSEIFNGIVSDWLKNTTPEQRENFINMIYEIIMETQAQRTSDFRVETAKKIGIILNGYINVNPEDKKEIEHMVKLILESVFKVLKENRNTNKLMEKEKSKKINKGEKNILSL
ncbi:MAG TPA: DUF2974 domain-containing protein [Clostridiaceae bacterium]|jgi:hypothetical protein|nr:DUF2974 domain-containing protein [Clostridiaceae bacterium]